MTDVRFCPRFACDRTVVGGTVEEKVSVLERGPAERGRGGATRAMGTEEGSVTNPEATVAPGSPTVSKTHFVPKNRTTRSLVSAPVSWSNVAVPARGPELPAGGQDDASHFWTERISPAFPQFLKGIGTAPAGRAGPARLKPTADMTSNCQEPTVPLFLTHLLCKAQGSRGGGASKIDG